LFLASSVHVRPPPLTVIVVTAAPPSEATSATSSDPPGGLKFAQDTNVLPVSETGGGAELSSVSVPADRISACANGPDDVATVKPSVVAPGVPVSAVALNVTYRPLLTVSAMLSATVVAAAAVAELLPKTALAP